MEGRRLVGGTVGSQAAEAALLHAAPVHQTTWPSLTQFGEADFNSDSDFEGIHKWHADPDHPDAGCELALFGCDGFEGDREGLGIYARGDRTGYIVCTDQINRDSAYHIYLREGEPGQPHDHSRRVKVIRGGTDSTDGLEVTSTPVGPRYPHGLVIAMNSSGRNFFLDAWGSFAAGDLASKIGR